MPTQFKKDHRIDEAIQEAPSFAKPIYKHLRKVIRESCPQVEETIKWGSPWFMYQGKVLCGMVTFKAHFALLFNKGGRLKNAQGKPAKAEIKRMRRMTNLSDLPTASQLKFYVKQAMKLNEPGAKTVKRVIKKKPPVETPPDLMKALRASSKAFAVYEAMNESVKRHYVDWISDAKTPTTREKRLEKSVECIAEGKARHWL